MEQTSLLLLPSKAEAGGCGCEFNEVLQGTNALTLGFFDHLLEDLGCGYRIPEGRVLCFDGDLVSLRQGLQPAIQLQISPGRRERSLKRQRPIQNGRVQDDILKRKTEEMFHRSANDTETEGPAMGPRMDPYLLIRNMRDWLQKYEYTRLGAGIIGEK